MPGAGSHLLSGHGGCDIAMKRSFAIISFFLGLNLIIFWLTSVTGDPDQTVDPIDRMVEPPEKKTLLAPDETAPKNRSLLLGDVAESARARFFLTGESFQSAAADVIPSLARLQILYRGEGEWFEEWTIAVCVDADGFFLSPWSRVTHGELFRLQFQDGAMTEARLDSMDPATGIALFQCTGERTVYQPVGFGPALSSSFGQPLIFLWLNDMGHPQSQEGRLNGVEYSRNPAFPDAFTSHLQTDILVSGEQSGGVLVDFNGRLLGLLISENLTPARDLSPMLASEEVRFVVRQLREQGFVNRSRIGIDVQRLNSTLQTVFPFTSTESGVIVSKVNPGSSAAKMGIRPGDLITQISGRRVLSSDFFNAMISRWPAGKEVPLMLKRGEERIELAPVAESSLKVEPDTFMDVDLTLPKVSHEEETGELLTFEDREVNVNGDRVRHPVVVAIEHQAVLFSPALHQGDVLLQINEVYHPDAETAAHILRDLAGESAILFRFYRQGRVFWSVARPLRP